MAATGMRQSPLQPYKKLQDIYVLCVKADGDSRLPQA